MAEVGGLGVEAVEAATQLGFGGLAFGDLLAARLDGTFVIGGLTQENVLKRKGKIPILGDIPIVGAAFPSGVTVAAINSATTFTLSTGTGVTAVTGSTASGGRGTGVSTLQAQTFNRLANSNGTLVVTSSNTGLLGNSVALAGVATTVGSNSVSATSVASLAPGMAFFGQGFPSGVTVTSVNYVANTFTISANSDVAVTAGSARMESDG